MAAALLDPLGVLVHVLPRGTREPVLGQHCAGSYSSLGDTVGQGTTPRTSVVNLWFVRRDNAQLGWIVKTYGGLYWYEDPQSAYYEEITAVNADELRDRGVSIGGCFRSELAI